MTLTRSGRRHEAHRPQRSSVRLVPPAGPAAPALRTCCRRPAACAGGVAVGPRHTAPPPSGQAGEARGGPRPGCGSSLGAAACPGRAGAGLSSGGGGGGGGGPGTGAAGRSRDQARWPAAAPGRLCVCVCEGGDPRGGGEAAAPPRALGSGGGGRRADRGQRGEGGGGGPAKRGPAGRGRGRCAAPALRPQPGRSQAGAGERAGRCRRGAGRGAGAPPPRPHTDLAAAHVQLHFVTGLRLLRVLQRSERHHVPASPPSRAAAASRCAFPDPRPAQRRWAAAAGPLLLAMERGGGTRAVTAAAAAAGQRRRRRSALPRAHPPTWRPEGARPARHGDDVRAGRRIPCMGRGAVTRGDVCGPAAGRRLAEGDGAGGQPAAGLGTGGDPGRVTACPLEGGSAVKQWCRGRAVGGTWTFRLRLREGAGERHGGV